MIIRRLNWRGYHGERRKLTLPQADNTAAEKPKRRYPVTPAGLRKPEMVQPTIPEPKIVEIPSPSSKPHTDTPRRRPRFEDRYTRVTTYIENDLNERLRHITYSGDESITSIVNTALKVYLKTRYPES